MHKVPTAQLKPGMKLGRTIMNNNNQVLLAAGTILTKHFIHRLSELGIPSVYIDHGFLPGIQIDDVISDQTRHRAIALTKKIFHDFRISGTLKGMKEIEDVINSIIEELLDNENIVVNLADIRSSDEYTFGHCVNTCVLALMTAFKLDYNTKQLNQLAMAAILHDLGKIMIPPEIINKPGKLTKDEFELIKKHAQLGYEILKENQFISEATKLAILHHHERYDGTGYPQGLQGDQIPEFSVIIGITDMYDALIADRAYRAAYPPHEVYEMLAASGDYLFAHKVVKAFLHYITAYPVGSLVQLNTGEISVVVENRPGLALRPKIKILFDQMKNPVTENMEIDLATSRTTTIIGTITDENELNQMRLLGSLSK